MDQNSDKTPSFLISVRFLVTIMAFFGYCLQYMLKINLGIAIVCMVNNTALKQLEASSNNILNISLTNSSTSTSPAPTPLVSYLNNTSFISSNDSNQTETKCLLELQHSNSLDGQFVWTKSVQGFLLASYFYGYIITQIPGGWLSSKYGGRNVLFISNLFASVLTVVTPFCARWNYIAMAVCRFLIGVAHGAFWPAMSSIFVCWAPAKERTKMIGSSTAGAWVGNIIALPLGGFLCVSGFDGGWASIFYIFGILGVVWSVVFFLVVTDSPKQHKFISKLERDYLIENTKKEVSGKEKGGTSQTPWKEIFFSKVCIATFVAHFCNNWGNYLYLTQLPSFMKDVLRFDIKSNGLMSAIPYIACASSTAVLGVLSDKILRLNIISRTNFRRLFCGIGLFVPMVFIIALSFVKCSSPYVGVAFLTIALGFNGFYWSAGPLVNINDIAGSFSGVVFGITNTFGTLPGIVCPFIVGFLTKNQTQKEWQVVFIICAIIYFFGSVFFWVFSNSNLQPWANFELKQNDEANSNEKKKKEIQENNKNVNKF